MLIAIGFLFLLLYSVNIIGHVPEYGIDDDPSSAFTASIFQINNTMLLVFGYLFFVSPIFILIMLVYNWKRAGKREKFMTIAIYMIGIIILAFIRSSSFFMWIVD